MHLTRIMYVENKSAEPANQTGRGPARIGRVVFSKSRQSVCYRGKTLQRSKSGYKWNYFDVESGERYWGFPDPSATAPTGCMVTAQPLSTKMPAKNIGPQFVVSPNTRVESLVSLTGYGWHIAK